MVLLDPQYALRISVDIRIYHDDAAAVYQLQAQERRPSSMAYAVLQIPQHVHRRHFRVCDKDADPV